VVNLRRVPAAYGRWQYHEGVQYGEGNLIASMAPSIVSSEGRGRRLEWRWRRCASGSRWLARSRAKSSRTKILEGAPEQGEGVRGREKVQHHLQTLNSTRTAAVPKVFR
jgi:hypothetical protein